MPFCAFLLCTLVFSGVQGVFVYFTITRVSTIPISAEVCYWLLWCWGFVEGVLFVWGIFFVVSGLFVCFNADFSWVLLGFFLHKQFQSYFAIYLQLSEISVCMQICKYRCVFTCSDCFFWVIGIIMPSNACVELQIFKSAHSC